MVLELVGYTVAEMVVAQDLEIPYKVLTPAIMVEMGAPPVVGELMENMVEVVRLVVLAVMVVEVKYELQHGRYI